MVRQRALEERGLLLYKQGRVPGSFYDGRGQEATCVGATFAMGPDDTVCPMIRDVGAHLVRGTTPKAILGHYMGRAEGVSGGRDGNIHFGEASRGVVGMVSMLADMMAVAVGMAWAFQMRGEQRCALSFFGDGATSVGDWHESMNLAGLRQVPVVFVLEHNGYAYSTPSALQFAVDPLERAASLRHRRGRRRRQRRRGRLRGGAGGSRARAGGWRTDADLRAHDADARPRRA